MNQEDRKNYELFLSLANVILTVTQSVDAKKRYQIVKFTELGAQLTTHMETSFLNEKGESWVMIILSFHQMCGHSWQLFELNNDGSIAKWSESPVES